MAPDLLHRRGGDDLPPDLTKLVRFLPWISRPRINGKTGKCPVRRLGSKVYPVQPDSPEAWLSLTAALEVVRSGQAQGVGMCLAHGVCVLDLDDVIDADGQPTGWLPQAEETPTYVEYSPSLRGVHLWYTCSPGLRSRRGPGWDLLTAGAFVTVTGLSIEGAPLNLAALPDSYADLSRREPGPVMSPVRRPAQVAPDQLSTALEHSGKLRQLYLEGDLSGYRSASEADLALCQLLHRVVGPDPVAIDGLFRTSALMRPKWADERYRVRTIELAIRSGRWGEVRRE
jgi:putative DNA primase/helicase